jgi:hypothetical protein
MSNATKETFSVGSINKIVMDNLTAEKQDLAEYTKIKELLTKCNGKNITRCLSKELIDYRFKDGRLEKRDLNFDVNIHLWTGNIINYVESVFDSENTCYSIGTIERIKQLELIDTVNYSEKYTRLFEAYSNLMSVCAEIKGDNRLVSHKNPVFYDVFRLFGDFGDTDFIKAIRQMC